MRKASLAVLRLRTYESVLFFVLRLLCVSLIRDTEPFLVILEYDMSEVNAARSIGRAIRRSPVTTTFG